MVIAMPRGLFPLALGLAIGLVFLVSPAGSSGRAGGVVDGCSTGSVPAFITGKHVCLKQGSPCKRLVDIQYRRYGFACKRGRSPGYAHTVSHESALPPPMLWMISKLSVSPPGALL